MQDFPALSIEPALTHSNWQTLLAEDPIRACRRYYYQLLLVFASETDLRESIAVFQEITQRNPSSFLKEAQQILPTLLSNNFTDVWSQISKHNTSGHNPYLNFVSPYILLKSITRNLHLLNEQARESGMPSLMMWATSNQARIRTDWQNEVAKLAVVLEEINRPDGVHDVQFTDLHSSLIPYPNENEWSQLWHSDPGAAQKRLAEIQMVRAQTGLRPAFSVGESIAAFQAIVQAFPTSGTIDTIS